jgi:5'-deoxynucleotidase YfbR-like HD superfamily hydrolase
MQSYRDLLKLSHVPRWSIIDTVKDQSVGEHTFRVMAIAITLRGKFLLNGINVDKSTLLEVALIHDIDEAKTGDIPTPFKRKGGAPRFFNVENQIVKIADYMEALIFLFRYGLKTDQLEKDIRNNLEEFVDSYFPDQEWLRLVIKAMVIEGFEYE